MLRPARPGLFQGSFSHSTVNAGGQATRGLLLASSSSLTLAICPPRSKVLSEMARKIFWLERFMLHASVRPESPQQWAEWAFEPSLQEHTPLPQRLASHTKTPHESGLTVLSCAQPGPWHELWARTCHGLKKPLWDRHCKS